LESAAAGEFEQTLFEHIKTIAPKHVESIGDDGTRQIVKDGIERARGHGFTKRGPVRFFVEMMFLFGSEFDTDPLLPWADGVLSNTSIQSEMERADILHEAMAEYVERVAGNDKKYLFDSMKRFGKTSLDDHQGKGTSFDAAMLSMFKACYPERCDYVGDDGIRSLIEQGKDEARKRSIKSAKGAALLTVLLFQLGHAALRDPLFPWVSQTLDDETVADPNERVKNLKQKAIKYSDQALKNLGQISTDGAR
jgi:hypothetical protein